MVIDQIILPHLWRRYLSLLRALVGSACLWLVAASGGIGGQSLLVLLSVVVVYSLIAAFWRKPERLKGSGLVGLALDILTFFLCLSLAGENGFWVVSFASLYLFMSLASLQQWREVLLFTVVSLSWVGIFHPPNAERLQPVLLLLGIMGCVLSVQRKNLLDRLSNTSRQLVLFRSESQRARESERERIAADFHDGPLQSFISFQMRLEIVRRMFERNVDAGLDELRELRELCDKQITELRTFVRGMRPVDVDGMGLATALRGIVGSFQKDSRITTTFHADFDASHDDIEATTDLLQVVREALNNVQKHSGASRVAITLSRVNGSIVLQVEDDGTGFPFAGTFTLDELEILRMGPASIKRRVRSLNGDLLAVSHPGHGATLKIRVPVAG